MYHVETYRANRIVTSDHATWEGALTAARMIASEMFASDPVAIYDGLWRPVWTPETGVLDATDNDEETHAHAAQREAEIDEMCDF